MVVSRVYSRLSMWNSCIEGVFAAGFSRRFFYCHNLELLPLLLELLLMRKSLFNQTLRETFIWAVVYVPEKAVAQWDARRKLT